MPKISGAVKNIVFENERQSFAVFRMDSQSEGVVCVTVNSIAPMLGEKIVVSGDWSRHPRFGRQFAAMEWHSDDEMLNDNLSLFLQQRVSGVGEKLATRIVACFGADLYEVLSKYPERLAEVRGVSSNKATEIAELFCEYNEIRQIKTYLEENDVSGSFAPRIAAMYGAAAIDIIADNPYRLCEDFEEIGFEVADCIAKNNGIEHGSMQRMRAGITFALLRSLRDGHSCFPRVLLVSNAGKYLGIELSEIDDEITAMNKDGDLIVDWECNVEMVFLPYVFHVEERVATLLHEINSNAEKFSDMEIAKLLGILEQRSHITLAGKQKQAITSVLNEGVTIITGGPGTGKTTIIRCIKELFEHCGLEVVLAAPTGRAARRLGDASGAPALTLHRLLEAQDSSVLEERFSRHAGNVLEGDVFVVDEASMVDVILLHSFLDALPKCARLVIVGDSDQLPSVGPGMVLRDLLRSESLPVVQLDEVFRQAAGSAIVRNSHRIRKGIMPINENDDEFSFKVVNNAADAAEQIAAFCSELISSGVNAVADVQVITPMYRADCGVDKLNRLLQTRMNELGEKVVIGKEQTIFRVGDKVIQMRNNYEKSIYNGDIGNVVEFGDNGMLVKFYDNDVLIAPELLRDVQLAYAITVHKSQGSEYPVVVLALCNEHAALLGRTIIYTAVTRAKSKFVAFGSMSALRRAVNTERAGKRWTALESKIRREGEML